MSASEWKPNLGELVQVIQEGEPQDASELLESARIDWKRDWDAVALGFVMGVLATLAVQQVW